ncbi:MAG: hypothetical protein WAZ18_00850 [Alphaproteobacteria bacterium]
MVQRVDWSKETLLSTVSFRGMMLKQFARSMMLDNNGQAVSFTWFGMHVWVVPNEHDAENPFVGLDENMPPYVMFLWVKVPSCPPKIDETGFPLQQDCLTESLCAGRCG